MGTGTRIRWLVRAGAPAILATGALVVGDAHTARADCLIPGVPVVGCTAAKQPASAPDPGGSEAPNQPVPPAGKPWGFNLGYKLDGDTSATTSLQAMAAVGVTHLRYPVHWRAFADTTSPNQPVPPEMVQTAVGDPSVGSGLRRYDDTYLDLTAQGITPVIIAYSAPLWASTLHRCSDAFYQWLHPAECPPNWKDGYHAPAPEYYGQWRAWVAAVARRYPRAIIEGPNEPDHAWNQGWATAVDPWAAAEIQCELYRGVRSVDGRTVLSMGLSDPAYERTFIARASACYDAFSFHPYPGDDPTFGAGSTLATVFRDARAARAAAGDTKPIWVTETGYNTQNEAQFAPATQRLYNRLVTMPDVGAVLFHTLRDAPTSNDPTDHFGFFAQGWIAKPRACLFVRAHGGTWTGC